MDGSPERDIGVHISAGRSRLAGEGWCELLHLRRHRSERWTERSIHAPSVGLLPQLLLLGPGHALEVRILGDETALAFVGDGLGERRRDTPGPLVAIVQPDDRHIVQS